MGAANLRIHPAAALFPMLSDAELDELAADISKNGLRDPITRWADPKGFGSDVVLDGRNRLEACRRAGIDLQPTMFVTYGGDDPVAFVLSKNLHRRQLTESQRAIVGAEVAKLYEEEAKRRQQEHGRTAPGRKNTSRHLAGSENRHARESAEKAAKVTGASGRSIQRAKRVLENGAPEVVAAVQSGKVTVSDAVKVVDMPREKQVALVAKVQSGQAPTVAKAAQAETSASKPRTIGSVESVWSSILRLSPPDRETVRARLNALAAEGSG